MLGALSGFHDLVETSLDSDGLVQVRRIYPVGILLLWFGAGSHGISFCCLGGYLASVCDGIDLYHPIENVWDLFPARG